MNKKRWVNLVLLLAVLLTAVACGAADEAMLDTVEVTRVVTEVIVEEGMEVEVTRVVEEVVIASADGVTGEQAFPYDESPTTGQNAPTQPVQRLIIKDGQMTVVVEDTETAVTRAINLTVSKEGYIIAQSMHDDTAGYRYATLRLAVPVDKFEQAMRELGDLGDVTNESARGEDVTDEFVDLSARLGNLEATRDRLLTFLDQAQTVHETLEVNEELKQVEEEIAVIQGRLNFIVDRAAFSTIDLEVVPWIPTPTPSPTPTQTPTATPTPIPTADAWRPNDTVQVAAVELQDSMASTADFFIYYGIVCGPWLLLLGLFGYGVSRVRGRWETAVSLPTRTRPQSTRPQAPTTPSQGEQEDES